jgi:seryl-tRNA synthetase
VGYGQLSFLSSSVVEASLIHSETPENELIRIRLERENLVMDKKEKIQEKQAITAEQKSLTEKIQKIEEDLLQNKKMIDKINADIAAFPAPDLEKIEAEYRQKQSQEYERYEKQKITTQKLYVDTMNLIQQTHDERVKKG